MVFDFENRNLEFLKDFAGEKWLKMCRHIILKSI